MIRANGKIDHEAINSRESSRVILANVWVLHIRFQHSFVPVCCLLMTSRTKNAFRFGFRCCTEKIKELCSAANLTSISFNFECTENKLQYKFFFSLRIF